MENDLSKQHQTLIVLWFAMLLSVGFYLLISLFVAPAIGDNARNPPPSSLFVVALTAVSALLVTASFVVKRRLLERSVEKQDVSLVQKALIIACAMCEASALLGLLEFFVVGNRQFYMLFLLAAAGIAFHFPRRIQLEAASYKDPAQLV